ncbi:alpha/beta hydrolase [Trueperella sp. LYQ141]|uniref:alpha/beta hydrolase n=1 Tax=Trueperella sp. LYQ141 TaxID=3391058 RepID=UPI0039837EA5
MKSYKKIATVIAVSAMGLAACSADVNVDNVGYPSGKVSSSSTSESTNSLVPQAIEAPMPAIPSGLEKFYTQKLTWTDCDSQKCADLTVPMDYQHPDGKTITLRMRMVPARGTAIGNLLTNPGGPGASGQEIAKMADQYFDSEVLDSFNLIGFDPRGVGDSTPVDCLPDKELISVIEASYPDTPEGTAQNEADAKKVVDGCVARTGDVLKFLGTEEAARDMDVMRHVLGDPQLYYVGFSYGTSLGGMYAQLFPKNVGRLILDGAVDDSLSSFDQYLTQTKGFERAFNAYLESCLSNKCPLGNSVDEARAKFSQLAEQAKKTPFPGEDNRTVNDTVLLYGVILPLYDNMAWPALTSAFDELVNDGKAGLFQRFFDMYISREGDTLTSNMMEANWAISCADTVVTGNPEEWKRLSQQAAQEAPIFGKLMQYSEYMCSIWPGGGRKTPLGPYVAKGSAPIVVVGTTGDPATPYEWAQKFAKDLDNGVLVTWKGDGHTAYGRAGDCISKPLDEYLLTGKVPQDGLTCEGKN